MKKQLANNALFGLMEKGVSIITVLLLTPYFISILGDDNYGLWILILSVISWFNFVDMGFSATIQRKIAIAIENNNLNKINAAFSCAIVLFVILGGIASTGVFFLGVYPEIIGVDESHSKVASIAITVFTLKVFFDFIMSAFHGFYSGALRYDIDATLSTSNTIFKSICIFYLIPEYYIYGAVFATMLSDVIFNAIKIFYAKRICEGFKFEFKLVTKAELLEIFSYSKHVAANIIARSINENVDPLIIAKIMDLQKVGLYSVANRLVGHVQSIITACLSFMLPAFSRLMVKKTDIRHEFNQVVALNFFISSSLLIPLVCLGQWFLYLWLGEKFESMSVVLLILAYSSFTRCISFPVSSILLAGAKHKLLTFANLLSAFLNLLLSIFLGGMYGLEGIAIATLISSIIGGVIVHLILLKKQMGYSVMGYIKTYIISSVLLFAVGYFCSLAYQSGFHRSLSILEFIATAIIVCITSVLVSAFLYLDKPLRIKIKDTAFSFIPKKQLKYKE